MRPRDKPKINKKKIKKLAEEGKFQELVEKRQELKERLEEIEDRLEANKQTTTELGNIEEQEISELTTEFDKKRKAMEKIDRKLDEKGIRVRSLT